MSLRKNIEYLRKQKKLSQEELAFKLGVSRQAVSKWESGGAFPETDKMMSICKIFDCSLDDLMNEDISQLEIDKNRKYTFNDLVSEITDIVNRTINMFDSMTFKSIIRFGFEMFILFILILLLHIPFSYLFGLGNNVFININGNIANILSSIWKLITEVVYIVVAVVSFVYIYKIRFLDKFEVAKKDERKIDDKEETAFKDEVIDKKGRKVEIRRYDFGLFSFIGKVALFCIKCFTAFVSLPIIFLLFVSVACVLIGIVMIFEGVLFLGVILFLISLIVFAICLLYLFYNFIVNHRTNWQKLFIFFIACVLGFGIGAGVSVLEFSKMTISNTAPKLVEKKVMEESLEMKDNYIIQNLSDDIEYLVDESMGNMIKINIQYYDVFTNNVEVEIPDEVSGDIFIYPVRVQSVNLSDLYTILVDDLKQKTISNYILMKGIDVKVYGSEASINMLKGNIDKRINMYMDEPIENDCGCLE